jgi:hypothetical protein
VVVRDQDHGRLLRREGHAREQFRKHAKLLEDDTHTRLFILTPDPVRPSWLGAPDGVSEHVLGRVLWLSFRDLADTIDKVISDPARVVAEQARFLLAELAALYENDGLLTADDTVIVAARRAWPEYCEISGYVCQPEPRRTFREGLTHFGFYAEGAIQSLIARIRARYPAVEFTREEAGRRRAAGEPELAGLIEQLLDNGTRDEGELYGVFLPASSAPADSGAPAVCGFPCIGPKRLTVGTDAFMVSAPQAGARVRVHGTRFVHCAQSGAFPGRHPGLGSRHPTGRGPATPACDHERQSAGGLAGACWNRRDTGTCDG